MMKQLEVKVTVHGNAVELRKALAWMKERMNAAIHDGSFDCDEALAKIDAALAAPLRNCDRFESWQAAKATSWNEIGDPSDWRALGEWLFAKERKV